MFRFTTLFPVLKPKKRKLIRELRPPRASAKLLEKQDAGKTEPQATVTRETFDHTTHEGAVQARTAPKKGATSCLKDPSTTFRIRSFPRTLVAHCNTASNTWTSSHQLSHRHRWPLDRQYMRLWPPITSLA